ncbi:hypothetical protein [Campylobacter sp.]|uniref:hypothetical protein n=1 Tax=Campylobacter sp. TaxID=205 RepID=UPI002AA6D75C|nr:hypothetical protein [Campylobacter sp.]MCI7076340.1 hypothetical protein [Campylobacter sp.]
MQGKILSPQLISGDDGKRYEYDKNDVINLDGKDLALLTGSQVEFLSFDKRVAKSIYIIAENLNVSSILSADSISSARTKALWGIGLEFFSCIPYIGENIKLIIGIASFVLYSMAIYSVSKAAASKSLFKNYIITAIIGFLGAFFFMLSIMLLDNSEHVSIGRKVIAVLLLGGIIALMAAIYLYKIHAELARLSGSSLFLWSFWIFVVSVPLYFVFGIFTGFAGFTNFAGFVVSIIVLVPLFVAWWRFGKVEKR